ncbi:hypothetical protein D9M71_768750 [compost metagenome]
MQALDHLEDLSRDAKLRVGRGIRLRVGQPNRRNGLLHHSRAVLAIGRVLGRLGVHDQGFTTGPAGLQDLLDRVRGALE